MRTLFWKAGIAGAAIVLTTAYAVAQMAPGNPDGQMPQGHMSPEQMMGMKKQMSQMMDHCNNMMRASPNDRRDAPAVPEKKG